MVELDVELVEMVDQGGGGGACGPKSRKRTNADSGGDG